LIFKKNEAAIHDSFLVTKKSYREYYVSRRDNIIRGKAVAFFHLSYILTKNII